jgi:ATP-dependent DNA helicase RecG
LRQRAATGVGDVTLKDLADEDILRALRFADVAGSQGQSLTVGAVLMFGTVQAIQRFIPTAEVGFQVLTQAGTSLVQNDIAYVSLLQAMDDFGLRFQMVNRSQEMLVGMRRIDLPEVAEPVFREALANALVHRDYSIGGATLVQVSEKGLRVRSPGGFLPDVSISNLVEETKPRSPALADAFKRAGYVERTGRGVPRMYIDQISNGRPTPDYSQTTAEEVSVFFGFGKADQEMYLFLREWEAQGRSPLDARDLQMMRAIRDLVDPDTEELSERVQLSSDRVRLIAGDLAREGCIAVRGRGRGRNYVLAPLFDDLVGRELPRGAGPAADAEEQRELVLKAAAIRPVTRSDVVKACRVSGPAATYLLKRLVEEGLLERHGQRRGTYYTLAKKAD